MKFGRVPVHMAEGALLGHAVGSGSTRLQKGRILSAADIASLQAADVETVLVARLESGDVAENEAALTLAQAMAGANTRAVAGATGRANVMAAANGVLRVEPGRIDAVNLVDEALTVATAAPYARVAAGQMLATVKVIPFAAPRHAVSTAAEIAAAAPLAVAPFRRCRIGLITTYLPGTKKSLLDKTEAVMAQRAGDRGATIAHALRVSHDEGSIADAFRALAAERCSPVIVVGATATADRNDVAPAGLVSAGGAIDHFGMPVDPGNLLLLGRLGGAPVVIAPGCARSPKENGFDWVLDRLLAGIEVSRSDIMRMGAGGLLKEITSRPSPRARTPVANRDVAALVLAAGRSQRMGAANKLLAMVDGKPIVAHVVDRLVDSGLARIVIVTGHQAEAVAAALAGRPVAFVHNADYAAGMAASIRTGIGALGAEASGAMICLGDMPRVAAGTLRALRDAFDPDGGNGICVPVHGGRRGNPVIWAERFFPELAALHGDVGGRTLFADHEEEIAEVPVDDPAIFLDIDTQDALAELDKRTP
jgi:molybdenum cofactor cytidylyltransferase